MTVTVGRAARDVDGENKDRDFLFSEEVGIGHRPGCLPTRVFVRYGEGGGLGAVGKEAKEGDRLKRDRDVKLEAPKQWAMGTFEASRLAPSIVPWKGRNLLWTVSTYDGVDRSRLDCRGIDGQEGQSTRSRRLT